MVTVIRPSRARCVEGRIARHRRAVLTFKEGRMPVVSTSVVGFNYCRRQLFGNAAIASLRASP
jgi:hypothetical protein